MAIGSHAAAAEVEITSQAMQEFQYANAPGQNHMTTLRIALVAIATAFMMGGTNAAGRYCASIAGWCGRRPTDGAAIALKSRGLKV